MSKKSCVIYDSWGELIVNLPDEMAGELIKQILSYAFDMDQPAVDNPAIGAMFAMIKTKLDEDADAYEVVKNMRSEAARKRWSGCKPMQKDANACTCIDEDANACSSMQKDAVSVSDSVYVSDKDIKEKEQKKKFVKPSVEEVRAYCSERGNSIDPESFVDFYESKGWKVGNNPMKDWKAAVRTWEKRESKPAEPNRSSFSPSPMSDIPKTVYDKIHNYQERDIDYTALGAELMRGSP